MQEWAGEVGNCHSIQSFPFGCGVAQGCGLGGMGCAPAHNFLSNSYTFKNTN